MSDDIEELPPEDADAALAAEFTLRLLGPAEQAACAAREAADPSFAAAVARWRTEFAALDGAYGATPPPAAALGRIEARLFGAPPTMLARLWGSAGLWRGLAAVTGLLALWLAFPLETPAPQAPGPRLVSALAPAAGAGAAEYLAVFEPQAGALSLNRVAGSAPPGRALELWVIPDPAGPPVSLGVLPEAPLARVDLEPEVALLIAAGAVLAVTDEPPGGSPSGAPTGAIRAAGPLRDI